MSSAAGYVPMMTPLDLLAALQTILGDQDVGRHDLEAPTKDRICLIYLKMLLEFGMSQERLTSAVPLDPTSGGIASEHPELFQHTLQQDRLLAALRMFFQDIRHPDAFGLMDLLRPDPLRTRAFLSSMANFWGFCNGHFEKVEEVRGRVAEKKAAQEKLEHQLREVKDRIGRARKRNAEDAVKTNDLDKTIAEIGAAMQELAKETESLNARSAETKAALMEERDKENKLSGELADLNRQTDALTAALKGADLADEMKAELKRQKDALDDLHARMHKMDKQLEEMDEKTSCLKNAQKVLGEAKESTGRTKSSLNELRGLNTQSEVAQDQLDQVARRARDLGKEIAGLRHVFETAEAKYRNRVHMKEAEVVELKTQVEEAREGLSHEEVVAAEFRSRAETARGELKEIKSIHEQNTQKVRNEYFKILEMVKTRADKARETLSTLQRLINEVDRPLFESS